MTSTQEVRVTSDTKSLLNAMKSTFTNSTTVVSEMLQNARRAGATRIDITSTQDSLTVADNGKGIENFSVLFALAKSGWDEAVMESDLPFGIGFTACYFACQSLTVMSKGQRISAPTADLLDVKPMSVMAAYKTEGTTITLDGVCEVLKAEKLKPEIERMVRGFPVPVFFNGVELKRPHACGNSTFYQGQTASFDSYVLETGTATHIYLQGLPVKETLDAHGWHDGPGIIHLDANTYVGRMPDRDVLIDSKACITRLKEDCDEVSRAYLSERAKSMEATRFVVTHLVRAAKLDMVDLVNSYDLIPQEWVASAEDYPTLGDRETSVSAPDRVVTRDAIRAQGLFEVDGYEDDGTENLTASIYVHLANGFLMRSWNGAPEWHWLHGHVQAIENADIRIDLGQTHGSETLDVHGDTVELKVVESIRLTRVGKDGKEVGKPQEASVIYNAGDWEIVATPEACASAAVCLVSNFQDGNDYYDEESRDKAERAFRATMHAITASDPAELFNNFINEGLPYNVPESLRGRSFTVAINEKGVVLVTLAAREGG